MVPIFIIHYNTYCIITHQTLKTKDKTHLENNERLLLLNHDRFGASWLVSSNDNVDFDCTLFVDISMSSLVLLAANCDM